MNCLSVFEHFVGLAIGVIPLLLFIFISMCNYKLSEITRNKEILDNLGFFYLILNSEWIALGTCIFIFLHYLTYQICSRQNVYSATFWHYWRYTEVKVLHFRYSLVYLFQWLLSERTTDIDRFSKKSYKISKSHMKNKQINKNAQYFVPIR